MIKAQMLIVFVWLASHSVPAFSHSGAEPIFKFRVVAEGIYAGANPVGVDGDAAGVRYLRSLGIHTVVSLQGADVDGTVAGRVSNWLHHGERPGFDEIERCAVEALDMTYINLPIRSRRPWGDQDYESVQKALEIFKQATPQAPVYLHCQRGIDRTGLIVALYRVQVQGWTPAEAYAEWDQVGRSRVAKLVTAALDDYYCERFLSRAD